MRDKLSALLGIESGEESMVSMLLTQSVFLGIFFGAFDITAHSLFLSVFDEKMMARAYIVSGIAGIILTSLYSWLQTKMQFRKLAIFNLTFVTALTLILWLALILSPSEWVIFMVFLMLGPLNILALLGFWGTTDRLFSRDQGKRLLRLTDTGLITGIIIISFTIPLLLSLKIQLQNILLISAASVLATTIIQILTGNELGTVSADEVQQPGKSEKGRSLLKVFREDSYLRIIGIFSLLSVLILFFIQYSFMAVTRVTFPAASEMAVFLGIFTGCIMIFILFVKLSVFKFVLHNYGLRTCLVISPVLIAVLTALTISFGLLMGYTPAAGGFIIFFIFLALGRMISKSLKDSLESPSFMVIYQSVDKKIKPELRSAMAGAINEVAVLFSGLILSGLGLLSFFRLIDFSLLLFIIALTWLFVAFRLLKEYRKSIIKITKARGRESSETGISNMQDTVKNRFNAYLTFRRDYFRLISGDYSVLDDTGNKWYFEKIIDFAYSKKDINLLPVLKKISNSASLGESVLQHSTEVAEFLQKRSNSHYAGDENIATAIKTLSGTRKPQTTEILRLLGDNSVESKRLAIYMIGKFRLSDLLSEVCECLSIRGLTIDATEVIKAFGPGVEDELVRFYLIKSGNTMLSRTILRIIGKTCTGNTTGFLFSHLFSNSRQLKEIAVKCLLDCNFKPSEEEKHRLDQLISEVIGQITWNLSAKISLKRDNDNFLSGKISLEINRWTNFLFDLLSITYGPSSISVIKEHLVKETPESISYALDMTDIVVSGSIKPKLISLLNVVPDEKKLRNLFQFYPDEIPAHKKLLEDIINGDYNLISLWTKACTLRSISKIEDNDMAESVTALLFSPEEIIQEEAANLIGRSNPGLYMSASERIPDSIKKRLDNIVNGTVDKEELLFEKTEFLSKYFGGITPHELLVLASGMRYIVNFNPEYPGFSEGCIIWPLSGDNEGAEVYVLYNGETDRLVRKYQGGQNHSFYFLPMTAIEEFHFQYPEKSYGILQYIDKHEEQFERTILKKRFSN